MIIRLSRNSFLPENTELVHPGLADGGRLTRGAACGVVIILVTWPFRRLLMPALTCLPPPARLRPLDPIYVPRKIGLPRWKGHSYMMFVEIWQLGSLLVSCISTNFVLFSNSWELHYV